MLWHLLCCRLCLLVLALSLIPPLMLPCPESAAELKLVAAAGSQTSDCEWRFNHDNHNHYCRW